MTKLDPQLEELARQLGDILVSSRLTPGERVAFDQVPRGPTRAVPVSNVARQGLGVNARRKKLIVLNNSASTIEFGDDDVIFGQGTPVLAGQAYIDAGDGVFTGEIYLIADVAGPLDIRVREEA